MLSDNTSLQLNAWVQKTHMLPHRSFIALAFALQISFEQEPGYGGPNKGC